MSQIQISKKISYQMMVRETKDHFFTEWVGSITLMPQEDGEAYVEISFSENPVITGFLDDFSPDPSDYISIECVEDELITVAVYENAAHGSTWCRC